MQKLKVVFFGTADFSVPTLELLYNHSQISIHSVVTMPSKPSGRGLINTPPPVAEFAISKKISVIQTENINKEDLILDSFKSANIDLFLVIAFSQFLSSRTLSIPSLGCFNIHASILPKYRGAAPIQYALRNGDTETGVCIQKMVKKMDEGDVALLKKTSISPNETGGQLYTRLKYLAALLTNDFFENIFQNTLTFTSQDHKFASYSPSIDKNEGSLNFKNLTATQIYNLVRAFNPRPGTFLNLGNKRLKVYETQIQALKLNPEELSLANNTIIIGCKEGSIRLINVQLEGKRPCSDTELLNGFKNFESLWNLQYKKLSL